MATPALSVIGIDPGVTGGIACITRSGVAGGLSCDFALRMPVTDGQVTFGRSHNIRRWMRSYELVVVEKVGARPGQGVTSMFNFGRSTGVVIGAVQAWADHNPLEVTPQVWKKHFGLIGCDKHAALDVARAVFPEISGQLKFKRDVGIADAALIAAWALEVQAPAPTGDEPPGWKLP